MRPVITDLQETHFPNIYSQFVELLKGKPWLKITEKHSLQIKANPFSTEQIYREYRVAYGLSLFEKNGMSLAGTPQWPTVQHALSFAAQVCELVNKARDSKGKRSYLGRVRGAFTNPAEMRAIRFEHLTAMTMYRQGAHIEWPDESSGLETFDLLVTDTAGNAFEVECKSCSPDKGRPITEKEASEFLSCMMKKIAPTAIPGEVLTLKIRVPKRLPKSNRDLEQLCTEIHHAFHAGNQSTDSGVILDHKSISIQFQSISGGLELIRDTVNNLVSTVYGETEGYRGIAYGTEDGALLCIEICSGRNKGFFGAMWETAKHAIQNQMTQKRPGCLVMRIEGLDKYGLERLAEESNNSLAWFAEKVLTDERHQHLACLAFISDEEMIEVGEGAESAQSCSYVFNRPGEPFGHLGIGRLLLGSTRS